MCDEFSEIWLFGNCVVILFLLAYYFFQAKDIARELGSLRLTNKNFDDENPTCLRFLVAVCSLSTCNKSAEVANFEFRGA